MSTNSTGPAARHGHAITQFGQDVQDSTDQAQASADVAAAGVTLTGTAGNDKLVGHGGDDSLSGLGGNDTLIGGSGNDTLLGGGGNDSLIVTDLNAGDSIDGGKGVDTLTVKKPVDLDFHGLHVLSGVEQIDLSRGADSVVLVNGMDTGVTTLTVDGGNGADTLDGSAVSKMHLNLDGGAGNDVIMSGQKADHISGGSGNDTIEVNATTLLGDVIDGGSGNDSLMVSGGGKVDLGNATLTSIEAVHVDGHATDLILNGADGGDTVFTGTNAGTVIEGAGAVGEHDVITLEAAGQTVLANTGDAEFGEFGSTVVNATQATLANATLINEGNGSAILDFTGGGTIDTSQFVLNGFNEINVDNADTNVSLGGEFEGGLVNLGNGADSVNVGFSDDVTIHGGTGGDTIDLTSSTYSQFIGAGVGNDTIQMDVGGSNTVVGGGGDDTFVVNLPNLAGPVGHDSVGGSYTLDNTIAGGSGNDALDVNYADGSCQSLTLSTGAFNGVETVNMQGVGGSYTLVTNESLVTVNMAAESDNYVVVNNGHDTVVGAAHGLDGVGVSAANLSTLTFEGNGEAHNYIDLTTGGAAVLGAGATNIDEVSFASDVNGSLDVGAHSNLTVYGEGAGGVGGVTQTLILGTGSNISFEGGEENDTVQIANIGQLATGSFSGGDGVNTLEFSQSGTFNLTSIGAEVGEFGVAQIDNGATVNLTLANFGQDWTVLMGDQAGTSVTGTSGADTFVFGAAGQTATGGDGNDTYVVNDPTQLASYHINETIHGGTDTVEFGAGGTFSLSTAVDNIEHYQLADASTNLTDNLTSSTNPGGYTIQGGAADDTVHISGGANNSAQLFQFVTLDGGENGLNGDTLEVSGGGVVDLTAANVGVVNFENIVLDAATKITLNDGATVGGEHVGGYDVTGSSGADTIIGGSAGDTIDGGAGVDSIAGGSGNDTIVLDASSPDIIDAGGGTNSVDLTGTAAATVVIDLNAADQFTSLAGNQSGFINIDASELGGAGVTVSASNTGNPSTIIGSNQADVFIFGNGDYTDTYVDGQGGSDIARFSGTNDLSAGTLLNVEAIQLDGAATLTISSDNVAGLTSISDFGTTAGQTLNVTGAVDLSGVTISGVETLGIENNATLTINPNNVTGVTAITGTNVSTSLEVTVGTLDLTNIAMTGVDNVYLSEGAGLIANAADLANVQNIYGGYTSFETLTLIDSTDISSINMTNVDTLAFGNAGITVTVDQSTFGSLSAITGNSGVGNDTLATSHNLDLTHIASTGIEVYDLNGGNTTLTANAADLASATAINGAGGTQTLSLLDSVNLSAVTFTNLEDIAFASGGLTVTVNGAGLGGVTNITGSTGSDTLALKAGTGLDLTATSISSIETLQLGGGGSTLKLADSSSITGVTAITGGALGDTIELVTGNLDLSNVAVTNVETFLTDSATGSNLTVNAADIASLTTLTMSTAVGSNDILTLANTDTTLNLGTVTTTGLDAIVLGSNTDTTSNSVTLNQATIDGLSVLTGSAGPGVTNTLNLTNAATTLDLSSGALTVDHIQTIVLGGAGDTTANTLTLTAASDAALSSIQGGATGHDILHLSGAGSFDFGALGVTNVPNVVTDAADQTVTLNGGGYHVELVGGAGVNYDITAGSGADHFVFDSAVTGAQSIDAFAQGAGHDVLDLSAYAGLLGYDEEFVTTAAATADLTANHGHAAFSLQDHTLYVDTNGDGTADLEITMNGVTNLTAGQDLVI